MPIVLGPITEPVPGSAAHEITLQAIEREVARRTGPFERHAAGAGVAIPGVFTQTSVTIPALGSTMTLGGYRGLWLLRRGYTQAGPTEDGFPISGFNPADRQRRIKDWTPSGARLDVDAPWAIPPITGEWMEICHLNPAQIIRPAVRAGLKRIRMEDRIGVPLTGISSERSLTAAFPWITAKSQVKGLFYQHTGSVYPVTPVLWYDLYERAGDVWATISPDPFPHTLYVLSDRSADSIVNGDISSVGPIADADLLVVPLDRAAAAGHIECWRYPRAAAMLKAMAERGFTLTQEQAADEHTRQNRRKHTRPRTRWQLSRPLWSPVDWP